MNRPTGAARDRIHHRSLLALAILVIPVAVEAQPVSVAVPPSLILPNYDRVPMGQREGIEGGAFLARTGDAAATWFNPAGLAKSAGSSLNASATAYEWTSTSLEGLGETEGRSRIGSIGTLFSVVAGEDVLHSDRWRLGFSIARPVAWQPSSIDLAATLSAGQERVAYSTVVDLGVMIPALAVAYAPGGVSEGSVRVGAGIGMAIASMSQTQAVSDRFTTPTSASITQRTFSAEGSAWHLKLTGGVQWDATPALTLGARAAAPSLRVRGASRLSFQSTRDSLVEMSDLVFRDPEAHFDYPLPMEAAIGVALRGKRGELEVDVLYYGEVETYDMYSSTVAGTLTVVDNTGTPSVSTVPFTTATNRARSLVNVAVGGSYPLSQIVRLHAGFSTDQSPVPDGGNSIFRQVDLNRATAGVSVSGSSLSGSLGFGYSFGKGSRQSTGTTEGGQAVDTQLEVRSVNLLFAFSYSFQGS